MRPAAIVACIALLTACGASASRTRARDVAPAASASATTADAAPLPTEHTISPTAPVWGTCADTFSPSGEPARDLERVTKYCGRPLGMHALTPVREASQSADAPVDRFTFSAKGGRCYRFYAVGDTGVKDLDLLVRDQDGKQLAGDASKDGYPIVPPKSALCLEHDGAYTLEVGVYEGAGRYAVQVWGN